MFEKFAEQFQNDVFVRYQEKMAELADIMEKSAGYGHNLRKGLALQKQLRQVGQQATGATGEQLAQLQAQVSS